MAQPGRKVWRCLENIRGLVGVPALWRSWLGGDFAAFRGAFLRQRPERAGSYPCPNACGRTRDVVGRADGSFVAVCACDPWNGDDFAVRAADLVLLELSWSGLGRALCRALECDVRDTDLGVPGARQIGAFSPAAVPVVLSIQDDRDDFRLALAGVAARLGKPFILLAPTSGFVDAVGLEMLRGARAEFFDLETNVLLMPSGSLQAKNNPTGLFAAFLPGPAGQAPDEVARQLFALVEELEAEGKWRKAPVTKVFHLYCVKGLSRAEVAKGCGCVPALVTLRLKLIEKKLGRKPIELRQLSPQFEQIEDSLSDPRAKNIYRKGAIYGDSPDDEQEE